MDFTNKDYYLVVIVIGAVVIGKTVALLVEYLFKKSFSENYITKSDCFHCKKTLMENKNDISVQIKIIKGLLLVIAVKVGIQNDQLKELIDK